MKDELKIRINDINKNIMNRMMKDKFNNVIKLFILTLILISCAKQVIAALDPSDEFEQALSYFRNRKYDKAIQVFERVIFYHASSEYVDDAQFMLGRAYLEKKDYAQAIVEFDYLIRNFPNSQFLEEAFLYRAKSHLFKAPGYEKDQDETKNAISLFDEFLTRFPNSKYANEAKELILYARNRLAKKELENGKLYERLKETDSAILYFKYVIENYPETKFASEAKFHLALIYEKSGKIDEALKLFKELLEEPNWKNKAEKRINSIERKT